MTYAANLANFSRTPQWIVELYMTACSLSYTVAPCTATDQGDGARCCYSFPTCQDAANFASTTRVFKFCLKDAPLAVEQSGLLPYLKAPVFIPQKIDPKRAITQRERVVLEFYDENLNRNFHWDKLAGLTNTSTAGTFWRRFREIYRNYAERRVVIKEGFVGDTEAQYQTRFDGLMADLEITDSGICKIEAVDKLKKAKRKIPQKISDTNVVRVALGGTFADLTMDVTDAGEFTDPAGLSADFTDVTPPVRDPLPRLLIELNYDQERDLAGLVTFTTGSTAVTGSGTDFLTSLAQGDRIWAETDNFIHAEEITAIATNSALTLVRAYNGRGGTFRAKAKTCEFCSVASVNVVTNQVGLLRRRDFTGVYAKAWPVGTKIREVYALTDTTLSDPQPVDALDAYRLVLQRAGVPDADIDFTGIEAERDLWHTGVNAVNCYALLTDEEEVGDLIQQLAEIGGFDAYVTEAGLVTAKVYAPALPAATVTTYSDSEHFIAGSLAVADDDEGGRLTRVTVAFDLMGDKDGDKPGHYHRVITRLNASAESSTGHGDKKSRSVLSRFLHRTSEYAGIAVAGRLLARFLNGAKTLTFSMEMKDGGLDLADIFIADTARIQTVTGANAARRFQVTEKKRGALGRWDFKALEASGGHRAGFIGPNTLPADYDSATAAQKQYAFIGTASNKVGNLVEDGYYVW